MGAIVKANVVSVSLFDDHVRYQPYLPAVLRAHHNLFRGWKYRIYHDHRLDSGPYGRVLRALEQYGLVELVFVTNKVMLDKALLWRLLPLWDDGVERFLTRDVDMVASFRERRAVEVWIRSGLAAHSMSDKQGVHDCPTMGGMMGFEVAQARYLLNAGGPAYEATNIDGLLARAKWPDRLWTSDRHIDGWKLSKRNQESHLTLNDQYFLWTHVWPRIVGHACEHRLSGSRTFDAKLSCINVDLFKGEDLGVLKAVRDGADALIPFIGASEIDLGAIAEFYQEHGDPEIERKIRECEALI